MKNSAGHFFANKVFSTPPPKHVRMRGKESKAKAFNDERFIAACQKYKADPTDVLARIISDKHCGDISLLDRGQIALRALKFLMAEKKAVEHTGEGGGPIRHNVEITIVDPQG